MLENGIDDVLARPLYGRVLFEMIAVLRVPVGLLGLGGIGDNAHGFAHIDVDVGGRDDAQKLLAVELGNAEAPLLRLLPRRPILSQR